MRWMLILLLAGCSSSPAPLPFENTPITRWDEDPLCHLGWSKPKPFALRAWVETAKVQPPYKEVVEVQQVQSPKPLVMRACKPR